MFQELILEFADQKIEVIDAEDNEAVQEAGGSTLDLDCTQDAENMQVQADDIWVFGHRGGCD